MKKLLLIFCLLSSQALAQTTRVPPYLITGTLNNAVMTTNGSGLSAYSTTLPSGLTYPSPLLTGTISVGGNVMTFPSAPATLAYINGSIVSGDCVQFAGTAGAISDAGAPCGSGGAAVSSVNDNGGRSLSFSPTTGSVLGGINFANNDTWSGNHVFNGNFTAENMQNGTGTFLASSNLMVAEASSSDCGNGNTATIYVQLCNTSTNQKRGINVDISSTNTSGTVNMTGILVYANTPGNFTGDSSGLTVHQYGGGNATTIYACATGDNNCSSTVAGSTGRGIELGCDGTKLCITEWYTFVGLLLNDSTAGAASATGILYAPVGSVGASANVLSVENSAQTFLYWNLSATGIMTMNNVASGTGDHLCLSASHIVVTCP